MRKNLLLLLALFSMVLTSCNLFNDYGKKVKIGNNEVFYKGEGVTEEEAKKLGEYLKKDAYFDDKTEKSVQLTKSGSDYVVRLVVDKDKLDLKNTATMNQYWVMQHILSENVFNGAKTRVVLADTKLKDIHPMEALTKIQEGNFGIYLRGEGITEKQGKAIAALLDERKYFGDANSDFLLEKKDGSYVVSFVYNKEYYEKNKEAALPVFKMIQWLVTEEVFNNAKTEVNLSTPLFVAFEDVGEFTLAQKQALLQQADGSASQYTNNEVTSDDDVIEN